MLLSRLETQSPLYIMDTIMKELCVKLSSLFALLLGFCSSLLGRSQSEQERSLQTLYETSVTKIDGSVGTLKEYQGNVLLIVNVASHCGFTPQYKALENQYQKYKEKGVYILGFPSNDFFNQEPGSNEEIAQFCKTTYAVSFPLFSKIHVRGEQKHPLYQYLTNQKSNPKHPGEVMWNFTKFLINGQGDVVDRFGPFTSPDSPHVTDAIEKALQEQNNHLDAAVL
jgi:glutathione peroxidase